MNLVKKKLLRKYEYKSLPCMVKYLHTQGDRVIVGDIAESFHFMRYKKSDSTFLVFADDYTPRWLTATEQLDYDTVVGGDKFGNVFILRLPADVSEEQEEDPTGNRYKWEQGYLNGAPYKLIQLTHFHVGETISKICKATLSIGGVEVILYSTLFGGIGALLPFNSKEDIDFFAHLEMHMRQESPPLCGRDHISFRSYYVPVKATIDGDLCELFNMLDPTRQRAVAVELDRSTMEVMKKLEDTRNKIL